MNTKLMTLVGVVSCLMLASCGKNESLTGPAMDTEVKAVDEMQSAGSLYTGCQNFYNPASNNYYEKCLYSDTNNAHGSTTANWVAWNAPNGKLYNLRPAFITVYDFIGTTNRIAKAKGIAQAASVHATNVPNTIELTMSLNYNLVGISSVSFGCAGSGCNIGTSWSFTTTSVTHVQKYSGTRQSTYEWSGLTADPGMLGYIRSIRATATTSLEVGSNQYSASATLEHVF